MPDFLFDMPLLIAGPLLVIAIASTAVVGLLFVRRKIIPKIQFTEEDAVFSSTIMLSIMVFYGLTVTLIAISVWEKYAEAGTIVSQEATELAVLYRDVDWYPQPLGPQMQDALREYTEYIFEEAWPQQLKGEVPLGGIELMNHFQSLLRSYEPATEGQKILHAETIRAYDQMIEARRMRLDAVESGLSGLMWAVTLIGGALGLIGTYFFRVTDQRLHVTMVVLLATFTALVIFVILAFDRPFRGGMEIGPGPYRLIYEQLMKH